MHRPMVAMLLAAVVAACSDASSSTTASETTTTGWVPPDLPPPDPDHPTCKIGGACSLDSDCEPGLACGVVGGLDEPENACGVPCKDDDQCKAGVCSEAIFWGGFPEPQLQGVCVTDEGGVFPYYVPEDLCPGEPVCVHDPCVASCAKLDVWNDDPGGAECIDNECILPCTMSSDCLDPDLDIDPTDGVLVECVDGRCVENGSAQDPCYKGLPYYPNSDP